MLLPVLVLVATPVFGLSFDVDPALAWVGGVPVELVAAAAAKGSGADADAGATLDAETASTEDTMAAAIAKRAKVGRVHRALGISTWLSMTAAVALGTIQYANLYGAFADLEDTRCVTGDAIMGQGQCVGTPWPHMLAAATTTALYVTTLSLSFAMPDPLEVSEGEGDFAKNIRRHKRLRWVHLFGMLAQAVLGAVVANGPRFGLERATDYKTLRALATVHMGVGFVTYGALTWAGATML